MMYLACGVLRKDNFENNPFSFSLAVQQNDPLPPGPLPSWGFSKDMLAQLPYTEWFGLEKTFSGTCMGARAPGTWAGTSLGRAREWLGSTTFKVFSSQKRSVILFPLHSGWEAATLGPQGVRWNCSGWCFQRLQALITKKSPGSFANLDLPGLHFHVGLLFKWLGRH